MRLTHNKEPWEHYIAEDFLDEEDFRVISEASFNIRPLREAEKVRYNILIKGNDHCETWDTVQDLGSLSWTKLFNREFTQKLYNKQWPQVLSFAEELGIINDYYDPNDLALMIELQTASKDYGYRKHVDAAHKFLTACVYIEPEDEKGTILYKDEEGNQPYQLPWKQNQAIIFTRKKDVTWHDWKVVADERTVLNINLTSWDSGKKGEIIKNEY